MSRGYTGAIILVLGLLFVGCSDEPFVANPCDVEVKLWVGPEEQVARFFDQQASPPEQPTYSQLAKTNRQYLVARIVSLKRTALNGTLVIGENGKETHLPPPISVYLPGGGEEVIVVIPVNQWLWAPEDVKPNLTFRWTELVWVH